MGDIFRIPNYPDINLQDNTELTADAASGQPNIAVIGTNGFAEFNLGILGTLGSLNAEKLEVSSVTATQIIFTTNLINLHRQTEAFTKLFGDIIVCYRVANTNNYPPTDTVFAANELSTTPLDVDQPVTLVTDSAGGDQFWYKFTYRNSITGTETALSASIPLRGQGFGHYVSIESIRREAGLLLQNQIQDTQIAERRDQAESEINGALLASDYSLPLTDNNQNPYTPPVIENIARMLAAGYVLTQDYGPITSGNTVDGDAKIKAALGILTEVQNHTIILVDINGQQMSTNARVNGMPTNNTQYSGNNSIAGNPPEPALFHISDVY